MDPYVLGWPGLAFIPVYIRHPDTGEMHCRQKPLQGEEFSYANNVEHRYVRLKVVLQLFPSMKRAMAEEVLMDLVREYGIKPIHWDSESHCNYVHVSALLAFLTVFPYCASFQLARGNILHFLTYYMETQCLNCGFINRDCTCDRVLEHPAVRSDTANLDIVAKVTDLTDKAIQTDPAELFCHMPNSNYLPPPPPLTAIQNGQLLPVCNVPTIPCNNVISQPPPLSIPPGAQVSRPPGSFPPVTVPSVSGPMQMPLWLPQGMKLTPGDRIPLSCVTGMQGQVLLRPQGSPWLPGQGPPLPHYSVNSFVPSVGVTNFPIQQPMGMNTPVSLPKETSQNMSACKSVTSSTTPALAVSSTQSKTRPIILKTSSAVSPSKENLKTSVTNPLKWPQRKKLSQSGKDVNMRKHVVKTKYVKEITIGTDGKEKITWVLKPVATSGWEVEAWNRKKKQVRPVHKTDSNFRLLSTEELKKSPKKNKTKAKVEKQVVVESNKNKESKLDVDKDAKNKESKLDVDEDAKSGNVTKTKAVHDPKSETSKDGDKKGSAEEGVIESAGEESCTTMTTKGDVKHDNQTNSSDKVAGVKETDRPKQSESSEQNSDDSEISSPKKSSESENSNDTTKQDVGKSLANAKEGSVESATRKNAENMETESAGVKSGVQKDQIVDKKMSSDVTKDCAADSNMTSSTVDDVPLAELNNTEDTGSLSGEEDEYGRPKKTYAKFEFLPTGDRMLRCVLYTCGQCFDTEAVAKVHARVHGYDRPNECLCYKCDYSGSLNQSADMLRHLWDTHGERYVHIPRNHVPCKLCGLTFPNQEKFEEHEMFHYYNRYKCVFCGCMMYTWKQVQQHLQKCLECDKGQVYHHCPYCLLSFRDEPIRIAHVKSHQDKGLICMACKDEKVWDSWKLLKSHYTMFHLDIAPRRIFRCTDCTMTFTAQKTFKKHVKKHEQQKLLDSKKDVKQRKKGRPKLSDSDKDEKKESPNKDEKKENLPVKKDATECPKCKKRFKESKNLQRHIDFVHGEEAKCPKCDFLAKSKMLLRVHQMTKHADRRHLCADCGKTFAYYHQYRVHMTTHSHSRKQVQVKCKSCDHQFENQSELRQHMFKDHPLPSNKVLRQCTMCDYRCFSRTTLKVHLKRDHPSACEEEDTADHSYFNKKLPPPPPPRRRRKSSGRGIRGGKIRGIGRKQIGIDRKTVRKMRMSREQRRMIKERVLVRKANCARVRSIHQHEEQKEEEKGVGFQVSLHNPKAAGAGPWKTGLGILSGEYSEEEPTKFDNPVKFQDTEVPRKRGPRGFPSRGRGRPGKSKTSPVKIFKKESDDDLLSPGKSKPKTETSAAESSAAESFGLRRSGRERKQTEKGHDFFIRKRRRPSRYVDEDYDEDEEEEYQPPKITHRRRSRPENMQQAGEVSPKRPRQMKEKRSRSLSENKDPLLTMAENLPPFIIEEEVRPVTIDNIPIALIDHSYFRTTTMEKEVRVKERGRPRKVSDIHVDHDLQVVETPDVGEFEECQTVENISLKPATKILPPKHLDIASTNSGRFTHIQIRGNRIVTPGSPEKGIRVIASTSHERSPVVHGSTYTDLNRDLSDQAVLEEILPAISELISEEQVESLMSENIDISESMLGSDLSTSVGCTFTSPTSSSRSLLSQNSLTVISSRTGTGDQSSVVAAHSGSTKPSTLGPELDDIELLEADYQLWQQDHEVATETVPAESDSSEAAQSLIVPLPSVKDTHATSADYHETVKSHIEHVEPEEEACMSESWSNPSNAEQDCRVAKPIGGNGDQGRGASAENTENGKNNVDRKEKDQSSSNQIPIANSESSDAELTPEKTVTTQNLTPPTNNSPARKWISDHQYF